MSEHTYICQSCDYKTDIPTIDCPKCMGFMRSRADFKKNPIFAFSVLCLLIVVLLNLNSFIKDMMFHFNHINPVVSYVENISIDPYQEPIQINYTSENKKFAYPTPKGEYILIPKAKYSIAGMVIAKNTNFWLRDVMRSDFDALCLIDLGIAWGQLVDPDYKQYLSYKSVKTIGSGRVLFWHYNASSPFSRNYIATHHSHNHIIPSNDNVMSALYTIKKEQIVELKGYLVDSIFPSGYKDETSLSRTDEGLNTNTRSGMGSCERMYVTSVKIGNKVYE